MSSTILRSRERPMHHAVRIAMISLALAGAAAYQPAAYAAGVSLDAAATRSYNLPAGPLGRNLAGFAAQSGIALSFDPALTAGLNSPALSGNFSARDALGRLLSGSGLSVVERDDGSYTLRKVEGDAPRDSAVLPTVQVTTDALGNVTEGTGSYTSGAANTATRLNMSLRETPQSVSVITRQRMEDQGLTQLQDVVAQTAGLVISQGGNAGSDSSPIYSRGFQVENYQIDGVNQLYSTYSGIFQSNDMVLYDRVEVVRGATGLMNGLGTPSATINLIRKKPTADFQGSARIEAGSWNYYRAEADLSNRLNESGTVRGRLVAAVQDNDSYIDRLHEKKKIVSGIVEADLSSSTLATVGFTYQKHDATGHARAGLPGYFSDGTRTNWSRSASAAASWAYSDREMQSIFGSLEHRFDNAWLVKGTLSYTKTSYDEMLGYASAYRSYQFPDRVTGANTELWAGRWAGNPIQTSLDLYATGPFELLGRQHDLVVGATSSYTRDSTVGYALWFNPAISNIYTWDGTMPAEPYNPANEDIVTSERINSAYTTARFKPTDNLSVILGSRITNWANDTQSERNKVTPYAGVVYDLGANWSTYVSYTDIFKPQSARDINNNLLDPLLGSSYEAGVKGEFFDRKLNVGAALYKIKQDNLAVAVSPTVSLPNGNSAMEAVSGTTTKGFEVEVGGEVARNWQASASYARNISRDRNDKLLNTQIPQSIFKLFTSYRMPQIGNGLTVGGGVRWQSQFYSDNQGPSFNQRFTQGAYSIVDLMARYQISKQMAATVNLYNVFDKWYYTGTGNTYYGAPRNIRVALDMRF